MGVEMTHNPEKVMQGLESCSSKRYICEPCPYFPCVDHNRSAGMKLAADALSLIKAQDEVISELRKVGYPHGYEQEKPWIVDYMNRITEVIRKVVRLNNGR